MKLNMATCLSGLISVMIAIFSVGNLTLEREVGT